MPMRYIDASEIIQHQHDIQIAVRRARSVYTVTGIRRLLGNTFIAFGTKLHGLPQPTRLATA